MYNSNALSAKNKIEVTPTRVLETLNMYRSENMLQAA